VQWFGCAAEGVVDDHINLLMILKGPVPSTFNRIEVAGAHRDVPSFISAML
jgi:hypothetical protein